MIKKEFLKLYLIQIFSTIFGMSVICFVILYFYNLGASLITLAIGEFLLYAVAVLIYFFNKSFFTRRNFIIIVCINILIVSILIIADNIYFLWPVQFLRGLFFIYFWVPFNTLYFKLAKDNSRAKHSAWTTIMAPVISSFVPLLSGLIVTKYNYHILFIIGAVISMLSLLVVRKIKPEKLDFNLQKSLQKIKGIKSIIFIEGMMHTVFISLIPLTTIRFIHQEAQWGAYISYLGVVGAITAIIFTFISDKYKIRKGFLIPLSLLLGSSIIGLSFANSFWLWGIMTGIFYALLNIFNPFSLALVLDTENNNFLCWAGREFILNCARALIMLIAIICLAFNNFSLIFLITGLLFLSYPVMVLKKKIY